MSTGWVAASIRARAMARRRLGIVAARRLAAAPTFEQACSSLRGTAYADAAPAATLAQAQRAVAGCILWQTRVLAGWMPADGVPVARALVAAFERENVVGHLHRLHGDAQERPADFELGSLGTAWNRVRGTTSLPALVAALSSSGWGPVVVAGTEQAATSVRDQLTAAWLCRLALAAPAARPVVTAAAVLLVARTLEQGPPLPAQAVVHVDGVLGGRWHAARDLAGLRSRLDTRTGRILRGVTCGDDLWVADVRLWSYLGDSGTRLLRRPIPGPEHVVGALSVLAADAFVVSAALVAAGGGGTEVLDRVA